MKILHLRGGFQILRHLFVAARFLRQVCLIASFWSVTRMNTTKEASIHFRCPNGHKIRTASRFEGRAVKCPCCGIPAIVASHPKTTQRPPITDTGAFAILTECEADAVHAAMQQAPAVTSMAVAFDDGESAATVTPGPCCPRCSFPTSTAHRICPECRLLLESTRGIFRRIYSAAVRSLR